VNLLQNLKDFISIQHTRQKLFLLGFEVFKYRPLFLQDMDKKEFGCGSFGTVAQSLKKQVISHYASTDSAILVLV
jgi:hypothetical protein